MQTRESIVDAILSERFRQDTLFHVQACEIDNTPNDYIAYITAYVGRAAQKVAKNQATEEGFRDNLIKAAAIIVAAIEKEDTVETAEEFETTE
jgi:hypothetical protein